MLRYLYADELSHHPRLSDTMFRDRAAQFHDRLGWEVRVDHDGYERDAYDGLDPLYIIWEKACGRHGGSLRLLPTTGDTMVNDHFLSLTDGVAIKSPFIWECTRFCLAPETEPRVAAALMLGVLEAGLAAHLSHIIGVFDARMVRIYRRIGWGPVVLGTDGAGREAISAGLWPVEEAVRPRLLKSAGLSSEVSRMWRDRAFGVLAPRADALSA